VEQLIDRSQLQSILERGLLTGKWSIAQFNRRDYWIEISKSSKEQIFPRSGFLKDHPQFLDIDFRDLSAYQRANHRSAF
jgi:hypothetical protein